MAKNILNFRPKEASKKLITTIGERARDILIKRFGLGQEAKRQTLEAIGSEYQITRERVRQIENFALTAIRKSEAYNQSLALFDDMNAWMKEHGKLLGEEYMLGTWSKDPLIQNHYHFLLVVGNDFLKFREDNEFYHRWSVDKDMAEQIHSALKNYCDRLLPEDLISEDELLQGFTAELAKKIDQEVKPELARTWLGLSKRLSRNPLGEWGLAYSPNVKMRGIRDFAYLVLRQNGSPMHFNEVSRAIEKLFNRHAHPATCHNELIKDKRFVLVGRGLYALTEWGYSTGTVMEVIAALLAKEGPLTREEIIARVLKERHVKENTILVNLQNSRQFRRDKGLYSLA